MTKETYNESALKARQLRWVSVYGAMVAIQVRDRLIEGRGAPDLDDMASFVEEAVTVADMSEEALEKLPPSGVITTMAIESSSTE